MRVGVRMPIFSTLARSWVWVGRGFWSFPRERREAKEEAESMEVSAL